MPKDHKQSTPRAGEGLQAGAARLGRAALQNHLHARGGNLARLSPQRLLKGFGSHRTEQRALVVRKRDVNVNDEVTFAR